MRAAGPDQDRHGSRRASRVTLCLALGVGCGRAGGPRDPGGPAPVSTGIVAHRGASHEAPENTLAALARAWELGAESCEIDVRLSRDGAVVLIHDDTTARTGGLDRAGADQTLAAPQAPDVGAWQDPRWRGERLPTLVEALGAAPAGRMLFVEIKTGPASATAVAASIAAADPRPRGAAVALQAYDPDTLAAAAALLPGVPAYWTVDPPVDRFDRPLPYDHGIVAAARARGFAGLALDHRAVDAELVAAVAAAGLALDVWTINDAAAIAAWRARAVRWIETDRPDLARP